jgi:hypothetical protein
MRPIHSSLLLLLLAVSTLRADPPLFPRLDAAPDESAPREPFWQLPQLKSQNDGAWGSLTSQTTLTDRDPLARWEDPAQRDSWKREDAWKSPQVGPFFAFGQFGGNGQEEQTTDVKLAGKTGLGCKCPLLDQGEIVFRGGPSVTYTDPLRPERTREESKWLLEVQGRWPLLARVGLEYQGSVAPALSPLDKNAIDHDLRLAIPVGGNGQFRVGAKQHWEGSGSDSARPWQTETQLYLGLELKR